MKEYISIEGIYSAGRLDMDSEGLLLLTDDGSLIHYLSDPQYSHPKTYLVLVEGVISEEALDRLRKGVTIQGYPTLPVEVEAVPSPSLPERSKPVTPHGPTGWLKMTLAEGKKRQIRHMTAAVGLPTLRLVRVSIGKLGIGILKPGEWRELSPAELALVMGMAAEAGSPQRKNKLIRHKDTRKKRNFT